MSDDKVTVSCAVCKKKRSISRRHFVANAPYICSAACNEKWKKQQKAAKTKTQADYKKQLKTNQDRLNKNRKKLEKNGAWRRSGLPARECPGRRHSYRSGPFRANIPAVPSPLAFSESLTPRL